MHDLQSGILLQRLSALNITDNPPSPVVIESGTRFVVEIGRFEWLGYEGLYTQISLPDVPFFRFRVRHHHLMQAVGRVGPAGVFWESATLNRARR